MLFSFLVFLSLRNQENVFLDNSLFEIHWVVLSENHGQSPWKMCLDHSLWNSWGCSLWKPLGNHQRSFSLLDHFFFHLFSENHGAISRKSEIHWADLSENHGAICMKNVFWISLSEIHQVVLSKNHGAIFVFLKFIRLFSLKTMEQSSWKMFLDHSLWNSLGCSLWKPWGNHQHFFPHVSRRCRRDLN